MPQKPMLQKTMNVIALKLNPQQDLKTELDTFMVHQNVEAACIVTCVGSLTQAVLRLAGRSEATLFNDRFEIVSLTGTMSLYGSHYHISIADGTGRTYGGHLLAGCLIYTTAEVVIGIISGLRFKRIYDVETGYKELSIEHVLAEFNQRSDHQF